MFRFFRNLTPVEQVTYIAQVATSLSFLGACLFSYLSWREARLAREDQRFSFIVEKRPRLEINNLRFSNDRGRNSLSMYIKNVGLTKASHIQLDIGGVGYSESISKIRYKQSGSYFLSEGINSGVTVDYPFYELDSIRKECECDFDEKHIYLQDAERGVLHGQGLFTIMLSYEGPFGSGWSDHYWVSVDGLRRKDPLPSGKTAPGQ